jgi:hypothetical protein
LIKKVLITTKQTFKQFKRTVEIVPNPKNSKWVSKDVLAVVKEECTVESKVKKSLIIYKEGLRGRKKETIAKKIEEFLKEKAPFIPFIIKLFWDS